MQESLLFLCKIGVIVLSVIILFRSFRSMMNGNNDEEVWAYIKVGKTLLPVIHWENIIGRGSGADIRVFGRGIGRTHAVLKRNEKGMWAIYDVFSKGGVWVNGERTPSYGAELSNGDLINLGGSCVTFLDKSETPEETYYKPVNPTVTLIELTALQLILFLELFFSIDKEYRTMLLVSFAIIICLQWLLFVGMKLLDKRGFEVETLAFYLTTIGFCVAASSAAEDVYKQTALILASVALFSLGGWWLSSLKRTNIMRVPIAVLALGLMALNVAAGTTVNGATNWLTFGGYSFQPSEFVKVCYIYVGAATLEALYRKKNLYVFIIFSAVCVIALALMGDFGTALIFFATFLIISFMRSGSIATVMLAITGAGLAGFLAVSVKPYIAQRFSTWGHAWEDIYDKGYQQTRAMSAAASGGLLGKGAGSGWLKSIVAANTDMVFAMVMEELGLIVSVCTVLAIVLMAFFAVRMTRKGRSVYYGIAACATMGMLLIQLALNVFGSLDILPFTGVTFPFVSKGGSSLIACWMLMAFLKSADTRKNASFAVRKTEKFINETEEEVFDEEYDEEYESDGENEIIDDENGNDNEPYDDFDDISNDEYFNLDELEEDAEFFDDEEDPDDMNDEDEEEDDDF